MGGGWSETLRAIEETECATGVGGKWACLVAPSLVALSVALCVALSLVGPSPFHGTFSSFHGTFSSVAGGAGGFGGGAVPWAAGAGVFVCSHACQCSLLRLVCIRC